MHAIPFRSARLIALSMLLTGLAAAVYCAETAPKTPPPDPWAAFRFFVGNWEGDARGEPGTGKASRIYRFVLGDRFLQVTNHSVYAPDAKHPKGDNHQDWGMFSFDKAQKKQVLRQFHIEGFVNQYVLASVSEDGKTIVFTSTAIENIPPGWRAREVYSIISSNEFVETFSLAEPEKDFALYSETRFKRK